MDGTKEAPLTEAAAIEVTVAETTWLLVNILLKEKTKDGQISKLRITKTGHQFTQYKKVINTLPVLCVDKNYQGIDDVIRIGIDLVEADFIPMFLDTSQWSNTHHVKVRPSIHKITQQPMAHVLPPSPWNREHAFLM